MAISLMTGIAITIILRKKCRHVQSTNVKCADMRKKDAVGTVTASMMVAGAVVSKIRMEVAMSSGWSSDWYADRFSDNDRGYSPCMHRNVVVDACGGRRFVEGEVTDDILVRAICLQCGEFLSESDTGSWDGEPHVEEIIQLEGDDDYDF
jgi:hypothetical protein